MNKINKKNNPPKAFKNRVEALKKDEREGIQKFEKPFRDGISGKAKEDLRNALAKEQKFICAYCERSLIDEESLKKGELKLKSTIKIEHFKSDSIYQGRENTPVENKFLCDNEIKERPDLRLEYSNLFLVCSGNINEEEKKKNTEELSGNKEEKKTSKIFHHCDTLKGNLELCSIKNLASWNKTDILKIKFAPNGTIYSDDIGVKEDLNKRLGLNEAILLRIRKYSWKLVAKKIARDTKNKSWEKGGNNVISTVKKYRGEYQKGKRFDSSLYYDDFRTFIIYQLDKRIKMLERNS
jgi:hypothetical protein